MPNRKDPHWRAERLADVLRMHVDANPIPYAQVDSLTTTSYKDGGITLTVAYDDGSVSDKSFRPGHHMPDMIFEAKQTIDKACTEIRKQRSIFKGL